ncbi:hypothetical protein IWQ62_000047 [Dispira parvispora]|uniref:Fungal lipase-type domain-containing protein n=1 Tax=Dispira parvispora TaxID=1520584 RepID=A0A9W8AVJ7_9FUNG|nr:hypothetical protein IWQ62_000047 [Dispira parvispora]
MYNICELILAVAILSTYNFPITSNPRQIAHVIKDLTRTRESDAILLGPPGSPLSLVSSVQVAERDLLHELYIWRNYSSASYKPKDQKWNCPVCLTWPLDSTDYSIVLANPTETCVVMLALNVKLHTLVMSFRGTDNKEGAIADLRANLIQWPPEIPESRVHRGFYDSYMSIRPELLTALKLYMAKCTWCDLTVTGHSLGGAQATLAALDAVLTFKSMKNKVLLYTFASPRPGNPAFARAILRHQIPVYRVVKEGDVVPMLPPQGVIYSHVGHTVWIKNDNTTLLCLTSERVLENPSCSSKWRFQVKLDMLRKTHSCFWGLCM